MRYPVRAAGFLAALALVVGACASGAASPSPAASTVPSATATPTATATATAKPTATPKPTPKPTATPKPTPTPVRGQYLLYRTSIVVSGGFRPQFWVVKADGTGRHKIVDGPNEPEASPPTHDIDAAWSHDGSIVHIVTYGTSSSVTTYCTPRISNLPIDGGRPTR